MGGRTPRRAVAESIPLERLHSAGPGGHDPHVWFDVGLWKLAVASVHGALAEILPADREALHARHLAYQARLDALHAYVKSNALRVPEADRVLVTAHDAFEYFGRAYGFEVRGLQGISTVSEAGTQDVQKLAAFIAQRRIPAIFVESSVPRKNVEALQAAVESRGFRVAIGGSLYSDAMGDEGTPEGTYEGMVRHNIDTIVGALLAGRP
jgi:manganese/zinc/iron transport system substrate-binding protein